MTLDRPITHTRATRYSPASRRISGPASGRRLSAVAGVVSLTVVFSLLAPIGQLQTAAAATISMRNASLETDANSDGVPDCWQRKGQGTNEYTVLRSTNAHTGQYGEDVTITGYTSGAQGLLVKMGSSNCGSPVVPGNVYTLGSWYRSTAQSKVTSFYRSASGSWLSWMSGPTLPLASAWTQASYVTPALPAGATEISFGISAQSVGTLTTDDYTLVVSGSAVAPPAGGYFPTLVPSGNVSALPSASSCASAVHRSSWEPRPDNYGANHVLVNPTSVHNSFANRPRAGLGSYDPRWDSWLLPRVDGQFTGTTDEIIQWAACKWGLADNYLRAEADTESTWFQYETYPSGRCVDTYGCGDWFSSEPYTARKTYCTGLATSGAYDYQADYGDGLCPKTFSMMGIMSWWNPSWGFNWAANQNGTFPFTRNSTAMAVDYMASQIRGCYEGWQWELGTGYQAGDLWGCAGAWYSGGWHDSAANTYISHVQGNESVEPWLTASFATEKPSCSPTYGCPGPGTP
jgi:hypothetical protein